MTVYCNCGFSKDLQHKNHQCVRFLNGMLFHFQNLNFGDGVKEIAHYIVSGDSVFLVSYGAGIGYGRRTKNIGSIFFMDYETIQSLEGEALLKYVSQQLIEETKKFTEKKIKNFDLEGYLKSLEEYFAEAMQLMREGKNPGEGKVLNEDIQMAMAKKWSKL
jgi:hypothetical protein